MQRVYLLLANGFEEAEAIVPADILKRAGAEVLLASTEASLTVESAHGMKLVADIMVGEVSVDDAACIILPGGAVGTERLGSDRRVLAIIEDAVKLGVYIGAICAAPSILGDMLLLDGRRAAVYPSFAPALSRANITGKKVEQDDIFITAEGMGVAYEFGFKLTEQLFGRAAVSEIKTAIRYEG